MAETGEAATAKRRPRIRLRLSVRALLAVVLVVGGGLGRVIRLARVQHDAVATIERSGGRVFYHWQLGPDGRSSRKGQPRWRKWLVDHLGPDFIGHVSSVSLGELGTDVDMEAVGRLAQLRHLNIEDSQVTGAGFVHLRGLAHLETIDVELTKFDGSGLANLRGLMRLRVLGLAGVPLSDAGLVDLAKLTSLQVLDLSFTPITDEGLVYLEGLTALNTLRLWGTKVTGAGLAHLRRMTGLKSLEMYDSEIRDLSSMPRLPGLESLVLGGSPIDDAGLATVARLVGLKHLFLQRTRVTDVSLVPLRNLDNLVTLEVVKTRITKLGGAEFAKARPVVNLIR